MHNEEGSAYTSPVPLAKATNTKISSAKGKAGEIFAPHVTIGYKMWSFMQNKFPFFSLGSLQCSLSQHL